MKNPTEIPEGPFLFGCDSGPRGAEVQGMLALRASELHLHDGMPVSSTGSEIAFVLQNEGKVIPLADLINAFSIDYEQSLIDHWGNPIMVEIIEVIPDNKWAYCRFNIISRGDYPRTKDWHPSILSVQAAIGLRFTNSVARGQPDNLP